MKNQWLNPARSTVVARILAAALAAFWAASSLLAVDVKLTRLSPNLVEIAADNWRLRYGINSRPGGPAPQLLQTDEEHAYYGYGGWLRLIDPGQGVVVGRWRFPGSIVRLTPAGDQIEIEIEDGYSASQVFRRTLRFDPQVPVVPYWPTEDYSLHRLPICEAQAYKPQATYCQPDVAPVPADEAQKMIVELEEAVRRDPLAPWHEIVLGKLLRDIGDARAVAIFQRAVQSEATDFTELLPISAFLLSLGERELARTAFERGYRSFWVVGNDPRLFTFLIGRLFLFNLKWDKLSSDDRTEWIERTYGLQPYAENAEIAWRGYADYLRGEGRNEEARLWDLRAQDARAHSLYLFHFPLVATFDQILLCFPALIVSVMIYVLSLYVRYWPQKELDSAAASRTGVHRRKFSLLNIEYWSRRERVAFFTIILIGWCAAGMTGYLAGGFRRLFKAPVALGTGSLAGPVTSWFLENHLAATPGRDLLLAVASQQDGQVEKAERLYRRLPDFAESWNNLGVILKKAGKTQEAQQAFEQALKLDPNLGEAMLNLGQPSANLWTESHKKYLSDRPMIAPPKRNHMLRAVLGTSSYTEAILRVLAGPYLAPWVAELGIRFAHFWWAPHLLFMILCFSLAILFVVPRRDVTQPAGSKQWIWETLWPGTSPAWGWLAGLALLAWTYFLVQIALLYYYGTPRIISSILNPNIRGTFGVPVAEGLEFLNPGWAWIYLPPALLFVGNLVLVWRARASRSSTVG